MPEDSGALNRQVGEILGAVKALTEQLRDIRVDSLRREERLSEDVNVVRNEAIQQRQVMVTRLETVVEQIREVSIRQRDATKDISELKTEVTKMRDPVHQMDEFRKRLIRYGLIIASAAGVVWSLLSGSIAGFVQHTFSKIFGM